MKKDHVEFIKWAHTAATRGHTKAQIAIAINYYQGDAFAQDFVEAYAWMKLAARGDNEGWEAVNELQQKLSPDELIQAEKRLAHLQTLINSQPSSSHKSEDSLDH